MGEPTYLIDHTAVILAEARGREQGADAERARIRQLALAEAERIENAVACSAIALDGLSWKAWALRDFAVLLGDS